MIGFAYFSDLEINNQKSGAHPSIEVTSDLLALNNFEIIYNQVKLLL